MYTMTHKQRIVFSKYTIDKPNRGEKYVKTEVELNNLSVWK